MKRYFKSVRERLLIFNQSFNCTMLPKNGSPSTTRHNFILVLASLLLSAQIIYLTLPGLSAARDTYTVGFIPLFSNITVFDSNMNYVKTITQNLPYSAYSIAVAPDGANAYVAHNSGKLSVIDTSRYEVAQTVDVGYLATNVSVTPNGDYAYVVNSGSDTVSVIDTSTNEVVRTVTVGDKPYDVAVSPNGSRVYVTNADSNTVSVINSATNEVVRTIGVGRNPAEIAVRPDGSLLYVANGGFRSRKVSVIDAATNSVVHEIDGINSKPTGITLTPDGSRAYVAATEPSSEPETGISRVYVIDTSTNKVVGNPITGGGRFPTDIAISPDGSRAYVTSAIQHTVTVIDTKTNLVLGNVYNIGGSPYGITVSPNQGPTAQLYVVPGRAGEPTEFDASGSADPDGMIEKYEWDFGDGSSATGSNPNVSHIYSTSGNYRATLKLTDNEGGSTEYVSSGKTAYHNGGPKARESVSFQVAAPSSQEDQSATAETGKKAATRDCKPITYWARVEAKRNLRSKDLDKPLRLKLSASLASRASVKLTLRRSDMNLLGFSKGKKGVVGKRVVILPAGRPRVVVIPLSKKLKKAVARRGAIRVPVKIDMISHATGVPTWRKMKRRVPLSVVIKHGGATGKKTVSNRQEVLGISACSKRLTVDIKTTRRGSLRKGATFKLTSNAPVSGTLRLILRGRDRARMKLSKSLIYSSNVKLAADRTLTKKIRLTGRLRKRFMQAFRSSKAKTVRAKLVLSVKADDRQRLRRETTVRLQLKR